MEKKGRKPKFHDYQSTKKTSKSKPKKKVEQSQLSKTFEGNSTGFNSIGIVRVEVDDCEMNKRNNKQAYDGLIYIPERPVGVKSMTPEQLQLAEEANFEKWKTDMAKIRDQTEMTPYEANLEFWRQLWRVIEKSDVVFQIVDARNPLLYRCRALERYVKKYDETKMCMLLINKSDFLTDKQRKLWAEYFNKEGIKIYFWSAMTAEDQSKADRKNHLERLDRSVIESGDQSLLAARTITEPTNQSIKNSPDIVDRDEFIKILEELLIPSRVTDENKQKVVGLVGYPNVGKSSTINALFGIKKSSVSATPGKTKRFQTLYVSPKLLLCDCPGLIFPSVVYDFAELMLAGVISIDQAKNLLPSLDIIIRQFSKEKLEAHYNIEIKPDEYGHPVSGTDLLTAYAIKRGFVGKNKVPLIQQAAKIILKEYTSGKLLYRHPPPDVSIDEFDPAGPLVKHDSTIIQSVDDEVKF